MNKNDIIKSDYIYYLNIVELKNICKKLDISVDIYLQRDDTLIKSGYYDDKKTMIDNIRTYHNNKKPKVSIYKKKVICFRELVSISSNDYIYFGQFKNGNKKIFKLMQLLTDGQFKFGSIGIDILRETWKKNKLITYQQFANEWIKRNNNKKIKKEWKYLTDLHNKTINKEQWKEYRRSIAKHIMFKL